MTGQTHPRILAAFLLTVLAGALTSVLLSDEPAKSPPAKDSVADLLQERLQVLTALARLQQAAYQSGAAPLNDVLAAEGEVLSAKLELAKTKAERLEILEQIVANARQIEDITQALFAAQSGGQADVLRAKAFRLRAQADLLRERGAQEKP